MPKQPIARERHPLPLVPGTVGIQPADLNRAVETARGTAAKQFRGRQKLVPASQRRILWKSLPGLMNQFPGGRDVLMLDQIPESVDVALRRLFPRNFDWLGHAFPLPRRLWMIPQPGS